MCCLLSSSSARLPESTGRDTIFIISRSVLVASGLFHLNLQMCAKYSIVFNDTKVLGRCYDKWVSNGEAGIYVQNT